LNGHLHQAATDQTKFFTISEHNVYRDAVSSFECFGRRTRSDWLNTVGHAYQEAVRSIGI
jgi:hypothetical protein